MQNPLGIHGNILWLCNPDKTNHTTGTFNLLCDESFLKMLHLVYNRLSEIDKVTIPIPNIGISDIDNISKLNKDIFGGKLHFEIMDNLFDSSCISNEISFSKNFLNKHTVPESVFGRLISECDILVSEFAYDFGFHVMYLLEDSIYKSEGDNYSGIYNYINELEANYGEQFVIRELDNNIYNSELFSKLSDLFYEKEKSNPQMVDLLNVLKVGYRVLFYDKPLELSTEELSYVFSSENYLKTINSMIITNQSGLDDSAALRVIFDSAQMEGREDNTKLIVLDKTDDIDKTTLKFILSRYKDSICFIGSVDEQGHDMNMFISMGCSVNTYLKEI